MRGAEIRKAFLDFFAARGHRVAESGPLLPENDPSLLFTNAGMAPFRDVFLGRAQPPAPRMASAQRCIRAGGKHNDLEEVGYSARHHTFFEMLGNFSFGDYFKREAIAYAWQFLTEGLELPAERLWVTVHVDDDEAERIWVDEIGFDRARISRLDQDNFWQMGELGPCGPCSEIFYDYGPEAEGGPPGSEGEDGGRYVEIWNLVFMQSERKADGALAPLPRPCIDTGMGLERISAVMQGVRDNYQSDLFAGLMRSAAQLAGCAAHDHPSLRVIADHMRSASFLLAEGLLPDNEGAGYVLRRIIRRAARHVHRLGLREAALHRLADPLIEAMGSGHELLAQRRDAIVAALREEEGRFARVLDQGMRMLDAHCDSLRDDRLSGDLAFQLYDTYGFPFDMTCDIARERGLRVDQEGFEAALRAQRERSRGASGFAAGEAQGQPALGAAAVRSAPETSFTGYARLRQRARVAAVLDERGERSLEALAAGERGVVILDETPFYAESGGQVGDRGRLFARGLSFRVRDTRPAAGRHLHIGELERGELRAGMSLSAEVDEAARARAALNHSATHLLHEALRRTLGEHVAQRGSLVTPERLRFDFSHGAPLTAEQLRGVERMVNGQIRANARVRTEIMPLEDARKRGALAMFGEKYASRVRVLSMGERDFSVELCGGTHARRTGDIGCMKIVSEGGVAAGVRRIEALTGEAALRRFEEVEGELDEVAEVARAPRGELAEKWREMLRRQRELQGRIKELSLVQCREIARELASQAREHGGARALVASLGAVEIDQLRAVMDALSGLLPKAVIVLASESGGEGKASVAVTVDKGLPAAHAGRLADRIAAQLGGKGGGNQRRGQGGGPHGERLAAALDAARSDIEKLLAA